MVCMGVGGGEVVGTVELIDEPLEMILSLYPFLETLKKSLGNPREQGKVH